MEHHRLIAKNSLDFSCKYSLVANNIVLPTLHKIELNK